MRNEINFKKPANQNSFSPLKFLSTTALTAASMVALGMHPAQADPPPWSQFVDEHGQITIDISDPFWTEILQHTDVYIGISEYLDIPEGYTVNIVQPDSDSIFGAKAALDADPTQILGALHANGNVLIIDRNGVFFGSNSTVDVGGLVATTGDISNDQIINNDFGNYNITNIGADPDARIEMNGTINIAEAGLAAFVAPTVINNGVVNAQYGKVVFAAGEEVTLDFYGDGLVEMAVDAEFATLLENNGEINAEGGIVQMSAQTAEGVVDNLINMDGVINVSSATVQGGKIILSGGDNGTVNVHGTLDASGTEGGDVEITGQDINVAETAHINVDGGMGADGIGNGGTATLIADRYMDFRGLLTGRGGANGGNGGWAEVSGYEALGYSGMTDMSAANGEMGSLLLDPAFAVIHSGAIHNPLGFNFVIASWALANSLANSNVTVQADNYIDVGTSFDGYNTGNPLLDWVLNSLIGTGDIDLSEWNFLFWSGETNGTLTLDSNVVNFNKDLTMGNGNLIVDANTINMDAQIFGLDGGNTVLLDSSRMWSTAGLVNILSNNAWIQQGIDLVQVGGTVNVEEDTYTENLVINKSLTLVGNNATIQDASGGTADALIEVLASNVTIDPFIFDGGGVLDYGIVATGAGASGLVVDGNTFRNFTEAGIYLANSGGGTSTIMNNIFEGSATRGVVFGTLDGNSIVNITGNTFGAVGDELTNALLFGQVRDATVNITGGTMHAGGGGGPQAGDAIHFANGLHNGAEVNITNVDVTASDEAIDFQQSVRNGAEVNINGGSFEGDKNGIEFSGIAGDVNITNADITGGTGFRGLNLLGTISGSLDIAGGSITGGEDAIGSGNDGNTVTGSLTVNGTTLNATTGHGIDIADVNGGTVEVTDATINAAQNGVNFGGNVTNGTTTIQGSTIDAGMNGVFFGLNIDGGSVDIINNVSIAGDVNGVNITGGDILNGATVNISGNQEIDGGTGDAIIISDSVYGGVGSLTISNNTDMTAGDDGLELNNLSTALVTGNVVNSAGDNGFAFFNSNNLTIGGYGIGEANTISNARTGIRLSDTDNVQVIMNSISDLFGGNTEGDGILLQTGQNVLIDGNIIDNVGDEGIFASGNVDGLQILNNIISNTGQNTGSSGNAIELLGTSGYANIAGNSITNAGHYGIWIKNPNANSSFEVDGNTVAGSDMGGILVEANAISVDGNVVYATGGNGIEVQDSAGVTVNDNHVGENASGVSQGDNNVQGDGIVIVDSDGATVGNNNVTQATGNGIYNNSSDSTVLSNNTVTFVDLNGILINPSHGVQVLGNTITGAGLDGIHAENSDNLLIDSNQILGEDGAFGVGANGADRHGIYVEGGSGAVINNNTIAGGDGLIFGQGGAGAGADGIHVLNTLNTTISNNNILGGDAGFFALGGNGANGHGIYTSHNGLFASLSDLFFHNGIQITGNTVSGGFLSLGAGGDGIHVVNSGNGLFGTAALIEGNTVAGVGGNGISVFDTNNVVINGNTVSLAVGDGIHVGNSDFAQITGNTVTGVGNVGVYVNPSSFVTIAGNTITGTISHGIEVIGGIFNTIIGNTLSLIGGNGIHADGGAALSITGNTVSLAAGDGIHAHNILGLSITGNTILGVGDDGIEAHNIIGANVSGNTVLGALNDGIVLHNVLGALVDSNVVIGTGDDGIQLTNVALAAVTNNLVSLTLGDGIYVNGALGLLVADNTAIFIGDDGFDIRNTVGANITGNTALFTLGDGIQVRDSALVSINNNTVAFAFDDGIDVEGSALVEIDDNTVSFVNNNGIEVEDSTAVAITDNTVTGAGEAGIFVDPSSNIYVGGNTLTGNNIGIHFDDVTNAVIEGNTITDSTTTGIMIENSDQIEILDNDITGSGMYGLHVAGGFNGSIVLAGNTFTDNPIGAHFESGEIDISDLANPNTFIGGDVALSFAPYDFGGGVFADMSLVGNTLGATIFSGQSTYYVQLDNGAFFNPGNPTIIDGTRASYDGIVPITDFPLDPFGNPIIPSDVLAAIEAMLFDFDDTGVLGQIFVGSVFSLGNDEDFFRQFGAFNPNLAGLNVTITGLPSVGFGASRFAAISPAAGDSSPESLANIQPAAGGEAADLNDIEPAAGGEDVPCWGQAFNALGSGGPVNYSFGGSFEESLADAAACNI